MTVTAITRRGMIGAGLAGAAALRPRPARAADRPLTVLLESEVVILDPHMTTAAITRTFGYQVFNTLFAMDGSGAIRPQMVEAHDASPDGLTWRFTLRGGAAVP